MFSLADRHTETRGYCSIGEATLLSRTTIITILYLTEYRQYVVVVINYVLVIYMCFMNIH